MLFAKTGSVVVGGILLLTQVTQSVSNDHVPALTAAVATDSSDLAHGTSDSSKKDSPSINTPAEAAALLGKTPVPPVPGEDPTLFLAEDYFDNVAPGSAWDV